jgi:ribosomal protein S18 acetylase RimI-like enzyme
MSIPARPSRSQSTRPEPIRPLQIRSMRASDLDAVVALIVALQVDPVHHIGYLDAEPDAVAGQLAELQPQGIDGHLVAADGEDGELIGFLGLEWDTEPPRVWWHGPMVADVDRWDTVADALYAAGLVQLPPAVTEQELFHDARGDRLAAFAQRHGFQRQTASAVLERAVTRLPSVAAPADVVIEPLASSERSAVAALHDAAFAGAHLPGHRVDEGERRQVLVARRGAAVVGYVAVEHQLDGEGYLDFLAVVPGERGAGIGAALVAAGMAWCRAQGCTRVHLTVREENAGARALYDRLGFTEVMIAVPWRIGVTIEAG